MNNTKIHMKAYPKMRSFKTKNSLRLKAILARLSTPKQSNKLLFQVINNKEKE
jgi:hypothetical protein